MTRTPAPYPTFSTITSSVPLGARENTHICTGLQKAERERQDCPDSLTCPPPRGRIYPRHQARQRGQAPQRRRFGHTLDHHRPLSREANPPFSFCQGFFDTTHGVDQPPSPRLSAAPDPPLGARLDCCRSEGAAARDFLNKVLVESLNFKVQPLALGRSKRDVIRE